MSMVRWSLFNDLDPVERHVRRIFEQAGLTPASVPAADVYETSEEYVVSVDVPGYDEQELSVEVADHTLAIKGRRAQASKEKAKEFALQERLERQFERRFTLPVSADTEHVKATFEKGVLEIHTPKLTVPETKKVAITTG